MDYDDFDNQFDSDPFRSSSDYNLPNDQGGSETGLDPLNFHDPVNSYSFLSDDAQDEISGGKKKNMKQKGTGSALELGQSRNNFAHLLPQRPVFLNCL